MCFLPCRCLESYVLSPRTSSLAWILLVKLRRLTAASVFESLSFLCEFPARCWFWFQPSLEKQRSENPRLRGWTFVHIPRWPEHFIPLGFWFCEVPALVSTCDSKSFMPRRFIPRFYFVFWGVRLVSTTILAGMVTRTVLWVRDKASRPYSSSRNHKGTIGSSKEK